MGQRKYCLEINSDFNKIVDVEKFINSLALELHLEEDKTNILLLTITEAVSNAIKHGNKYDKNKIIIIDVQHCGEYLIVKIIDSGEGFDINTIPDPTHPDNILKESGRGIYIMKFYVEELTFKKTEKGLETILKIKIK